MGSRISRALVLVVLCLTVNAVAQQSDVDVTFNAVPSSALTTPTSVQQVVQPDGKIIVYGARLVVEGIAKGDVVRLNADGTLDQTFSYCSCGLSFVRNLMLAPGGKMIVAGGEDSNAKMIRLNSDGSMDSTFVAVYTGPPPIFGGAEFLVNAVQPDGRVIATRRVASTGHVSYTLNRYATDGTVDGSFASINLASGSPVGAFARVELLPDGRFYLAVTAGVNGTGATLTRRVSDGSLDPTWEAPSFQTSPGFPPATSISDLAITADGGVLVAGAWDTVNGISRKNLIRLQTAGNVDMAFNSPAVVQVGSGVELLSDGKILLSGRTDISGINRIFRLNSDGSTDATFTMDAAVTTVSNQWVLDPSGRIVFVGSAPGTRMVRLLANGSLDATFNPNLTVYGSIYAITTQGDGKLLVAGMFTQMNGVARGGVARINSDGTIDPTFDPGTGFSSPPSGMVLQPDGKIIVFGDFTSYNGTPVNRFLFRINSNGSLDTTFAVSCNSLVNAVAVQADGKILIGGSFSTVNGIGRTGIVRLNTDDTLDDTFNPTIGNPILASIIVQADGKIVIGGMFAGVNGFNRTNLARLNGDGSLDQTFVATGVGLVGRINAQADGKYLLGIGFPAVSLVRRNGDGSADASFTAPSFAASSSSQTIIHSVVVQPDGSYIVGGKFDTVGTTARRNIARLSSSGAFDTLFLYSGANERVRALIADSSTKVIVGGEFSSIANVAKPGIARLNIVPFRIKTPFDFDGDGRADYTAYRPSSGVWYELSSGSNTYVAPTFGLDGDIPVPGDFDGDGKYDEAIYRPSSGDWWFQSSINNAQLSRHYGAAGDIPRPGDYDGDGKADFIVYRPSNNTWYRNGSSSSEAVPYVFGLPGDIPLVGDFDGDGKVDPAIFRPSNGDWWYAATSAGLAHRSIHWGATGDVPAPADFDGDGKTDVAVFRPSNGAWYIFRSSDQTYIITGFGLAGDRPVPADYDGDGRADIAVFRPSNGVWYLNQSTSGIGGVQWGLATDVMAPNAFLP